MLTTHTEGLTFLKNKYDLHNTPEVNTAARRTETRTNIRVPQKPVFRIQNYLERFHSSHITAVKKVILPRFTTKLEDFPDSYWELNDRIIRERGEQADWEAYPLEERTARQQQLARNQADDQKASLEAWIDFFASPDSDDLPDYFKYWAFRSVTDLKKYDKEKKAYPQRSRGTVDMFPEVNPQALRYVNTMLSVHLKGELDDRSECDLIYEQEVELKKWLRQENFARLYAFANDLLQPIPERLLQITEGEWVKYPKGSDHSPLIESILGRGTGWCTTGEKNAASELALGDFHCYYSLDDNGKPVIPRIAIRMRDKYIFEIRGIIDGQNIDPYMEDILARKLTEFPDRDKFLKRRTDMAYLTEIERKAKKGIALDTDELRFLYEIDQPIEGFGVQQDPRIKQLLSPQVVQDDLAAVFAGTGEIARAVGEINQNTRVWVGPLAPEVFRARQIEYIYTSFPGKHIEREKIMIGDKNLDALQSAIRVKAMWTSKEARHMLHNIAFQTTTRIIELAWLEVADFGLSKPTPVLELIERAKRIGLESPPPETAIYLRLAHTDQPETNQLFVGTKPILDQNGTPRIFELVNDSQGGLMLESTEARNQLNLGTKIAFLTPSN